MQHLRAKELDDRDLDARLVTLVDLVRRMHRQQAAGLNLRAESAIDWHGRIVVPTYHPSRQSTLHRAQAAQDADWRRLGVLAEATRGRTFADGAEAASLLR